MKSCEFPNIIEDLNDSFVFYLVAQRMQYEILNLIFPQKNVPKMIYTLRGDIVRLEENTQLLNIADVTKKI